MNRAFLRTAAAAAAVVVALVLTSVAPASAQDAPGTTTTTAPAGSTGAPVTPSGDPAIDDLVGCVQGSRELLVLFLIDESASLKQSDPEDRRVDAARGALDSLIALSSSEGSSSPKVDVALAAFSNEYRLVQDWTPAGADTADSLNDSLDEFADFNNGIDTDFVNALSAGRESLADQAATVAADGGTAPCRAVMLFTDGGYDLAVRTTDEDEERLGTTKPYAPGIELTTPAEVQKAEALGRKALCEPGGLADRLRNDDITLLTVALSKGVARRSQLPLAAATSGKADNYTCGTQPKKGQTSRAKGAYLPAEDIDVLVTQFNGVGTRLAGGNLVPGSDQVEICGKEPCDEGSRTLKLDRSLRRAQILALAPKEGAEVVIAGPSGDTATVTKAGKGSVGSTAFVARSVAGRGLAIDLDRPADDADWTGEWKVSITDPTEAQTGDKATLQLFVFSDIGVAFGKLTPLVRGTTSDLSVILELPAGVKAADVITASEAEVRLRNPVTGAVDAIPLEGPPGGPFTGTFATPASLTSNVVEATAEVRITTAGSAVLVSQSAPRELLVQRPAGSIQFSPGSLKMPSITGSGTSQVDLVLFGGDAPGCVWFGATEVPDPPDGASPIEVTLVDGDPLPDEARCIEVPADKATTITVLATPAGRASGIVSGTLEVFEKVDGHKTTTTQTPFRFDMASGVDQAQRLFLALLLLALGLGLPLLALLLLNALSARFQELDAVRGTALPVRVKGSTIQRIDGGRPRSLHLRTDDFGSLATAGNNRRFTFGGVEFRAQASRNPFGATIALAAPEGGAEKLKGNEGSRVELDPGLAGSWIFLLDSDKTRLSKSGDIEGLLIAFVAEGDITTQTMRMLTDITDRLPSTAAKLAGLVRSAKAKPAPKKRSAATAETDDDDVDPSDGAGEPGAIDEAVLPPAEPDAAADADADADDGPGTDASPAAPAAPTGFSGTARSADAPPLPAADPGADGPSDDGPGSPPVGFSGRSPDS